MGLYPEQPHRVDLEAVIHAVRFVAVVQHGKGKRYIAVDVPPALICAIADALRATEGMACDVGYARPADCEPGRFNVPHAIWHVKNPEHVMPCIDGRTVLDAEEALPALCEESRP